MSTHDHVFTLGIEEEFQIIDPETRELRSHIQQILADGKMLLKEHVKAEMHKRASRSLQRAHIRFRIGWIS